MKNLVLNLNHAPQSFSWNKYFSQKNRLEKKIGLQLMKELVQLMKGEIESAHQKGLDTTLVITIPNEDAQNQTKEQSIVNSNSSKGYFFIQKIQQVIKENLEDDEFGIAQLCRTIGISRSQLHNKIKAHTGLSTSIYIRSIRLKKAKDILQNSDFNVSEVAYQVGFKDPGYFSRLFNEVYGIAPSKICKNIVFN